MRRGNKAAAAHATMGWVRAAGTNVRQTGGKEEEDASASARARTKRSAEDVIVCEVSSVSAQMQRREEKRGGEHTGKKVEE